MESSAVIMSSISPCPTTSPPVLASAGSEIDYVIGRAHHRFVVLNDQNRVADIAETLQSRDESVSVVRMQSDGWLVADVQHAHQSGTDLCRQSNPLSFTT